VVAADGPITADAVRQAVRDRLAGYKVPKHVVFVEDIQRTPAGKARYSWAREIAQDTIKPLTAN
jgi:fatty-acyl-CoA synthase